MTHFGYDADGNQYIYEESIGLDAAGHLVTGEKITFVPADEVAREGK